MGLGLTISRMIIQELGGAITVTSEPKVGSTFVFWIPIHNDGLGSSPLIDIRSPEKVDYQQFNFD